MVQAFGNEFGIAELKITHGLENETAERGEFSFPEIWSRKALGEGHRKAGAKVRLLGEKLGKDDDRRPNRMRSARGP